MTTTKPAKRAKVTTWMGAIRYPSSYPMLFYANLNPQLSSSRVFRLRDYLPHPFPKSLVTES